MRKIAVLFGLTIILSCSAVAQSGSSSSGPSAEIGVGYAHLTGDLGKNGWNASAAINFTRHFGIEGDLGGYYSTVNSFGFNVDNNVYTYMFGPKVMFDTRDSRVTPFAHLLFGGGHEKAPDGFGGSVTDSAFTWMLGGGADLNFSHNFAARGKIDFVRTNFFDSGDTHARVGVGLVYKWAR